MAESGSSLVEAVGDVATRPRGLLVLARETRAVTLLVTSACAALAVAVAAPASAEPTGSGVLTAADTPDVALVQALDQVGIRHSNDRQAVAAANNVCQRIRDGFSPAETVEELQKANPGLEAAHADAFVKVARTVYCPGTGVGQLPGYPGQT